MNEPLRDVVVECIRTEEQRSTHDTRLKRRPCLFSCRCELAPPSNPSSANTAKISTLIFYLKVILLSVRQKKICMLDRRGVNREANFNDSKNVRSALLIFFLFFRLKGQWRYMVFWPIQPLLI
jgi:hypothetical protein